MEQNLINKMTEYKFLMFENDKNNCWLDASVSLIAFNLTIRKFVKKFPDSSIIHKIISVYDAAMSGLNDSTNSDLEDRLKKTRKKLLEIQTCTMRYLQQFLKYKFGEPDSAHCALLNLILKDQSNLKEHLNASWLWKKVCENCNKKTKSSIYTKPIITLSNVKNFHPEIPTSVYMCSCKTEQEMTLIYKELPPCLIFHFEKGAGGGESFPLNFKIKDRGYQLTGVIIMEKSNDPFVNHFITLIRDPTTNMWLDCNDLNTSVVSFSPKQPEWNLKDVYVYMFESFDNLGKVINELSADEDHAIENLDVEVIDLSDEDDEGSVSEKPGVESGLLKNETESKKLRQDSENVDAARENTIQNYASKNATVENVKQNNEKEGVTKDNQPLIEKKVEKHANLTGQGNSKNERKLIGSTIDYKNVPVSNFRYVPTTQSKVLFKYSHLFDESVKKESKVENLKPEKSADEGTKQSADEGTKVVNPSVNGSRDVRDEMISAKAEIQNSKTGIIENRMKQSELSKLSDKQSIWSGSSNDDPVCQMSQKPKLTADAADKAKLVHEINSQKYVKGESFKRTSKNPPPCRDSDSEKEKNLAKIKDRIPKSENPIEVIKKSLKSLHSSENLTKIKTEKDMDEECGSRPKIPKLISDERDDTLESSKSQMVHRTFTEKDLFGSDSENGDDNHGNQTLVSTLSESSDKKTNKNSSGFPMCDEEKETREEEPLNENELDSKIKKVLLKRPSTPISNPKKRRVLEKQTPLPDSDIISSMNVRKITVLVKSPGRKENIKEPKSPKRKEKIKRPKSPKITERMTETKSPKKIRKSEHQDEQNVRGSKENVHKEHKSKKKENIHNAKHEKNRFIKGTKTNWEKQVEVLVDTVVDKTFTAFIDTLFSGCM